MTGPDRAAEERRAERIVLDKERVIFFSDAVFAIAITLLAIELRLPDADYTNETIIEAIGHAMPEIAAFALSFMVIALFWIGHFRTFRMTERVVPSLIGVNLLFLAFVALLPFPTSVIAHHGDLPAAAIFYAVFVLATSLLSAGLWMISVRRHLTAPEVTPALGRYITIRMLVVPAVFAVSLPVALLSPLAAQGLWFISLLVLSVLIRRFRPARNPDSTLTGLPDDEND